MKSKEQLRKEIKEKRRKQTKEEQRKKSKEIKEKLFTLSEFKDAGTVLFYISYNGEVFTHDMIKKALTDKQVLVPISKKDDCSLILSVLDSWSDLTTGSYGILEPKKDCVKEVGVECVDLVIVPGVAFDIYGGRLGHGKGYYDRLFSSCENLLKIGLAFEFQIINKIPVDSHDKPVDIIVTEKRVINCKRK